MISGRKQKKQQFCYDYPRAMVTTDILVFGWDSRELQIMLIRRKQDPFGGSWALPGGFIEMSETLEKSARRELAEETGLSRVPLLRFDVFGDPGRDPRGRTVTIAYIAFLRPELLRKAKAGDDAAEVGWYSVRRVPKLAFDHDRMLRQALARLKELAVREPVWLSLLPRTFVMGELHALQESILNLKLDLRAFRREMISSGWIREAGHKDGTVLYTKQQSSPRPLRRRS
jgi:8-oxo-dGTP diphosphatase